MEDYFNEIKELRYCNLFYNASTNLSNYFHVGNNKDVSFILKEYESFLVDYIKPLQKHLNGNENKLDVVDGIIQRIALKCENYYGNKLGRIAFPIIYNQCLEKYNNIKDNGIKIKLIERCSYTTYIDRFKTFQKDIGDLLRNKQRYNNENFLKISTKFIYFNHSDEIDIIKILLDDDEINWFKNEGFDLILDESIPSESKESVLFTCFRFAIDILRKDYDNVKRKCILLYKYDLSLPTKEIESEIKFSETDVDILQQMFDD